MEKTEVKRQNIFNVDFTRKKVTDRDITEALITVVIIIHLFSNVYYYISFYYIFQQFHKQKKNVLNIPC